MKLDRARLDAVRAVNRLARQRHPDDRAARDAYVAAALESLDPEFAPPAPLELPIPEPLFSCAALPREASFVERISAGWLDAAVFAEREGDFDAALRCCDQAELTAGLKVSRFSRC